MFTERTSLGLDVHARSVRAAAIDMVTGEVIERTLPPQPELVVGFVNAGLLSLKQAISVIFGANIGTTLMAWIVSSMSVIKLTEYALPAVGIGFAIMAFGRSRKTRFWGEVLIGTGMLFVGLGLLKDACEPLKDTQQLKDLFVMFAKNPILGVLAGMVFTTLLQSSSVTIAIVQVLAFKGIISFSAAIPIVLGDNIGTTITAQLAALGTNINARRAAMARTRCLMCSGCRI